MKFVTKIYYKSPKSSLYSRLENYFFFGLLTFCSEYSLLLQFKIYICSALFVWNKCQQSIAYTCQTILILKQGGRYNASSLLSKFDILNCQNMVSICRKKLRASNVFPKHCHLFMFTLYIHFMHICNTFMLCYSIRF